LDAFKQDASKQEGFKQEVTNGYFLLATRHPIRGLNACKQEASKQEQEAIKQEVTNGNSLLRCHPPGT
jgi:hypothetical protein